MEKKKETVREIWYADMAGDNNELTALGSSKLKGRVVDNHRMRELKVAAKI